MQHFKGLMQHLKHFKSVRTFRVQRLKARGPPTLNQQALQGEAKFNWLYLDYPRAQFRKRAWMEFRSDLDEPSSSVAMPPTSSTLT